MADAWIRWCATCDVGWAAPELRCWMCGDVGEWRVEPPTERGEEEEFVDLWARAVPLQ